MVVRNEVGQEGHLPVGFATFPAGQHGFKEVEQDSFGPGGVVGGESAFRQFFSDVEKLVAPLDSQRRHSFVGRGRLRRSLRADWPG